MYAIAHISCQFRKDGEILCLPLLRTEVLQRSADLNLDKIDNYTGIFFLPLFMVFAPQKSLFPDQFIALLVEYDEQCSNTVI